MKYGAKTGFFWRLANRAEEEARRRAEGFRWDPFAGEAPAGGDAREDAARRPRAPLRVLLSDGGSSPFQVIADPRVEMVRPPDPRAAEPDIVVLARIDLLDFAASAANVPHTAWDRLASGAAKLVLDASSEGHVHHPERTAAMHGFLRAKGVALTDTAYVTQDRGYLEPYRDHCADLGLGDERMQVWVHDRHIRSIFVPYDSGEGEIAFYRRLRLYALAEAQRARRFISLNRTVRAGKAMFLLSLLRDGLWDKGFISLGPPDELLQRRGVDPAVYDWRLRRELPGFDDLIDELSPLMDRLEALAPIVVGAPEADWSNTSRKAQLGATPFPEYQQSWFTVVTETDMTDRLHRITEKPFKPLLNFHPLVFLASQGALRLLRAYGFETFSGFFDEAYDDEPDPRRRFDMVYEQVRRLCAADEDELARRNDAAAEAVVFNAHWGLLKLPELFRTRIDAALVDQLLRLAG